MVEWGCMKGDCKCPLEINTYGAILVRTVGHYQNQLIYTGEWFQPISFFVF